MPTKSTKTDIQTAAKPTAGLVSYPSGAAITAARIDMRREVLERDGCRCHFCKAPGGASILRVKRRDEFEHYVLLDTRRAYDANTGEALGVVPEDVLPLGKSCRVVLDLAYLDGNPSNVGRRGKRPNVVAACQRCNTAAGMAAIARAAQERADAEREAEFGPMLPLGLPSPKTRG